MGSALILAILLYTVLNFSDKSGPSDIERLAEAEPEIENVRGVEPASFQDVREFQERGVSRLSLSGNGESGAVVIITNRGERRRQVRVNDLGQWEVSMDVEEGPMVLEAQLYAAEDTAGIRSEETVFRLPTNAAEATTPPNEYRTPALIMVTAPGSPSRVIQSPFGGSPTSGPISLSVLDYDQRGGIIITGTSSVPGRVRIYAQDTVIGETGVGVGGRWNFIAGRMLPRAKITLTAELIPAQDPSGEPRERSRISIPFNFIPPLKEEDTDGSGALSVNVEPKSWQVRRTLIGGGGQSTMVFAPDVLPPRPEVAEKR